MELTDNYCVYGGRRYSKFDGVPSDHLIPEKAKLTAQFLGAFLFGLPLGILASYVWKHDHTFDPVLTIIMTVIIGYWCGLGYEVPPSLTLQQQIHLYGEPAWPYPISLYTRIESVLVVLFKISFGLLCVFYLWINYY
jgi:hypothetical protein